MVRIGIDCRFAGVPAGLGRYTREIVTHLLRRNDAEYILFVRDTQEEWFYRLPRHIRDQAIKADIPHYSLQEQILLPSILKKAKIDLLFSPHFNVPLSCPVPFVMTIHDLILHRFPNKASWFKQFFYRCVMGSALRRAQAVVAVSYFTASEIKAIYGKKIAGKTIVIHEGVGKEFVSQNREKIESVLQKYDLRKPFFLYVGNAKEHKNVQVLMDAFAELNDPSKELILVSGGSEMKRLHQRRGTRVLSSVRDVDLPALYSSAIAFVTASLYEGFCLPIIEATAMGCPVIAANRAAIREVAGAGSVLLEPTVEAFTKALRHPPMRAAHIDPLPFRWEDAAKKTAELILAKSV